MVEPAFGPFLFDASAESWLARSTDSATQDWFVKYLARHPVYVSAITVLERMRGFGLLLAHSVGPKKEQISAAQKAYLGNLGQVCPVDAATALAGAGLMVLLPQPPSPPRRAHRMVESRQDRLVRWRFDILVAATALVTELPLVHNNPADFEAIRAAVETSPDRFPKVGPLSLISVARLV